jgi:hypothetical protein
MRVCHPAAVLLTFLIAGCETSPFQIAPVSGKVTLDGVPLDGALVTFQPIGTATSKEPGPGSFGRTDSEGRFTLQVVEPEQPGAVVGKHRVLISTATSEGGDANRITGERVPRRYRDGKLQFTVPAAGSKEANFDLHTIDPVK